MTPTLPAQDLLHKIALTFIPHVGDKIARLLLTRFGSAEAIFNASRKDLRAMPNVRDESVTAVKEGEALRRAEEELRFMVKKGVQLLWHEDPEYPQRLKACADAPLLLYYRGSQNLNTEKVIAVIGTRKNGDYGQRMTEELVDGLAAQGIVVVSGLASGIDGIAHKRSVQQGVSTIGVLAHGLDRIYPSNHRNLAQEMTENGGLLTEFPSDTTPDRQNFPVRNRIVAGMSDVIVIVESDVKGGAMITAYLAHGYNREVAAFPGRVHDARSAGCNLLIKRNVASLITGADDLLELMNWTGQTRSKVAAQRQLSLLLSTEEQQIVDALQGKDQVHADDLMLQTGLAYSQLAGTLLQLELQGVVKALAGKYYRMD